MRGRPHFWKCTFCARHRKDCTIRGARSPMGTKTTTGRWRPFSSRNMREGAAVEYRCSDCGTSGWSSHADAIETFVTEHSDKAADPAFLGRTNVKYHEDTCVRRFLAEHAPRPPVST